MSARRPDPAQKAGFPLWDCVFLIGKLFDFPIAFALRRYSLLP
jgi:hypothetical protein